jgi:hypothetical protein
LFEGNDEEEAKSAESDYSMILDELVGSSALQSQASSADLKNDFTVCYLISKQLKNLEIGITLIS